MHWWFFMSMCLYTSWTLCHILLCSWSTGTFITTPHSTLLYAADRRCAVNTCCLHLRFRNEDQSQLIPSKTLVTTYQTLTIKTPLIVKCNPAEIWNTVTHTFNGNKTPFTLRERPTSARGKLTVRDLSRVLALVVLMSLERSLFCFKYAPIFKNKYLAYAHYNFGQISVKKYPSSFEVPLLWLRPIL